MHTTLARKRVIIQISSEESRLIVVQLSTVHYYSDAGKGLGSYQLFTVQH